MKEDNAGAETAGELARLLKDEGAAEVGFARPDDAPAGLPWAVSVVVPLSGAVVDEIDGAPTHSYFHHYRTVNALIDRALLRAGLFLQQNGWRYLPIPASQSIHTGGPRAHTGRYSHKKAAVLAGLGTVGKNALFLHSDFGPRVRLGTLFTDCPLPAGTVSPLQLCSGCEACVRACPAGALTGSDWRPGRAREELIDVNACNDYMRGHFMTIGRGSVCGICMAVCPRANQR